MKGEQKMSEERRIAERFVNEAEMAIGFIPRRIKRETVSNIIKRLKKAKEGEDVKLSIFCPITGMGYAATIHCL